SEALDVGKRLPVDEPERVSGEGAAPRVDDGPRVVERGESDKPVHRGGEGEGKEVPRGPGGAARHRSPSDPLEVRPVDLPRGGDDPEAAPRDGVLGAAEEVPGAKVESGKGGEPRLEDAVVAEALLAGEGRVQAAEGARNGNVDHRRCPAGVPVVDAD